MKIVKFPFLPPLSRAWIGLLTDGHGTKALPMISALTANLQPNAPYSNNASRYSTTRSTTRAGTSDSYTPSTSQVDAGLYSFSPVQATKTALDPSTRQGRDEMGEYYNNVLKNLRSLYDEPEAMRRYDEFMRSEGYVPAGSDAYYGLQSVPNLFATSMRTGPTGPNCQPLCISTTSTDRPFPLSLGGNSQAAYQTNSMLRTEVINGETQFFAQTFGLMHADRPWTEEMQTAWQSQSSQFDNVDTQALLETLPDGDRRMVAGKNDALGARIAAALERENIALDPDQSLTMKFTFDISGFTGIATGNADVDRVLNADPLLARDIYDYSASVAPADLSALPGQYGDNENGTSIAYSQRSELVYAPGTSESLIATNVLEMQAAGYTYVKQLSDEFDPSADSLSVMAGTPLEMTSNGIRPGKNTYNDTVDAIESAVANGTTVKSTITAQEYVDCQVERAAQAKAIREEIESRMYPSLTAEEVEKLKNGIPFERKTLADLRAEKESDQTSSAPVWKNFPMGQWQRQLYARLEALKS